jgi:hypothetical protein
MVLLWVTGGWFRETGVIKDVTGLGIFANAPTELTSYTYTDGGSWKGFAGSVCERDGVSRCAQVAAAANFGTAQSSVTIRMGYDYNFTTANYNQQPTRQYGSRFGCFTFPQQITLPVNLLSFNGAYNNQHTLLAGQLKMNRILIISKLNAAAMVLISVVLAQKLQMVQAADQIMNSTMISVLKTAIIFITDLK